MPRSPQFWTNHTLFEVGEYTHFFLIITRSCGLCSPMRSALLVMTTEHFRRRFKAKWHDNFLRTSNFISVTEADHHAKAMRLGYKLRYRPRSKTPRAKSVHERTNSFLSTEDRSQRRQKTCLFHQKRVQ